MPVIEIENLTKTFTTKDGILTAVEDVSLTIEQGDIYGIIGMSGAGKSTLVRCMNYLECPDKGTVLVEGRSLASLSKKELQAQRQKIGMIFQHFNLLMQKTVMENVCFPLYIQKVNRKEARKKATELLEVVGLSDKQHAYPAQLSGGQKQRVAIARALASDCNILLCDEATSALDPQTTASILELLKDINDRFGITIVIITHQMAVVRQICSHVAVMEHGQVVESGTVDEIFRSPCSSVAKELIREDVDTKLEAQVEESIRGGEVIRITFSKNSAFEPVIANMVLHFQEPVNILKASTKNVGGVAKGDMLLEFKPGSTKQEEMKAYLRERGVETVEVSGHVET